MFRRFLCACCVLGSSLLLAGCGSPVEFSPDGKHIVFAAGGTAGKRDTAALYIADVEGGRPRLLPGSKHGSNPRYSPDGNSLVFGGDNNTLLLHNVQTGRTRRLAEEVMPPFLWSADSTQLIVASSDTTPANAALRYLRLPDAEVTLHVPLGNVSILPTNEQSFWLPGTDDIVFLGGVSGERNGPRDRTDVYSVESGVLRPITTTGDVIGVGLAEGGSRIVWARKSATPKTHLLTLQSLDLKTGDVTRLPFPEQIAALNGPMQRKPQNVAGILFAPNGKRLLLLASRLISKPGAPQYNIPFLYVAGLNGAGFHQIATTAEANKIGSFSWSRDSRQIAVIGEQKRGTVIELFDANGTPRRRMFLRNPPA